MGHSDESLPITAVRNTVEQSFSKLNLIKTFHRSTVTDERLCWDRKARAACAQSFALWQQATTEFTRHDHSIISCSHHIYMVVFFPHIPFVVNHRINATPTKKLQQLTNLAMISIESETAETLDTTELT